MQAARAAAARIVLQQLHALGALDEYTGAPTARVQLPFIRVGAGASSTHQCTYRLHSSTHQCTHRLQP